MNSAPKMVFLISALEMKDSNMQQTPELLRKDAGVNVQSESVRADGIGFYNLLDNLVVRQAILSEMA